MFEGVPEVVELKREVLATASEELVRPEVIIASTTSTILVDDISAQSCTLNAFSTSIG